MAELPLVVFHVYKIMSWIINVTLQKNVYILNNLLLKKTVYVKIMET